MAYCGMREYLPGPGCEVIRNPKYHIELSPLVVTRNPNRGMRATASSQLQASTRVVDGERIASLRQRLIGLAGRQLRGTQTAPRLPLDTAAAVLGISVDDVRDLARRRRICETWEVQSDGRREQVVRAVDIIAMLCRGASPIKVMTR
jgi:hypothetical protein